MKPLHFALIPLLVSLFPGCARLHRSLAVLPTPPAASVAAPEADAGDNDREDNDRPDNDNEESEQENAKLAREFFLSRRLPDGESVLPMSRYMAAREHVATMPKLSIASGSHANAAPRIAGNGWTAVGPGNFGGRTRSLVIDPKNPDTMYAGSVTGGVFKSTDAGQNWSAQTDILPILNVGALVMDPNDSNTLYAGTGEYYQGLAGLGIFKTSNGGASWTQLQPTASISYTNKLVMSAVNRGRIYAATINGIYTSPDAGVTWTQMNLDTTQAFNGCQDLVLRTDTGKDYLYASCTPKLGASDYAIWRNTDAAGSGTWTQVFTAQHMGRVALAIAPSQQTTIYAMAESVGGDPHYEAGLLAVYRSDSDGDPGSWNARVTNADPNVMNTLLLTNSRSVTAAFCSSGGAPTYTAGQGGYDNIIAVDPLDPNRVWAGGIDLFRSDDGGMNWGVASLWQILIGNPQYAHADRHVILFHPGYDGNANQQMFIGTDGGLFRTDNARAPVSTGARAACQTDFQANSAVRWNDLNRSYAVAQFYHGAAYPGGGAYIAGAQDNTVGRGNDLTGINGWFQFSTGDGTAVGVDPADVNRFYESKQNLSLVRSINGINTLNAISGITEPSGGFPFVPYLAMDPGDGRRLYLGGTTTLWRSIDAAVSWSPAAPVENGSRVSAIAVSPFDSKTVLFGTLRGFIYFNNGAIDADGSTVWNYARPRTGNVGGIAFDPTNPNVVYATYTNFKSSLSPTDAHIYKSINGGVTWFSVDGSGSTAFPDIPAHRILVDPRNPQTLYVASDLGVFVSTDGGITWAHDPDEFSNVITEDLAFDQGITGNWLFAFTYGRSAYRVPLPGATANCTYSVTPTSIAADGSGGVYPVTVNAPPGCAWSALPGSTPGVFTIQSPATGTGNSQAFIVVQPTTSNNPRSDTVNIANTAVQITQSGSLPNGSDVSAAPFPLSVPGAIAITNRNLTESASDPVHTCTGSKDSKTGWWAVTPSFTGTLRVLAFSLRTDVAGNAGMVLSLYPAGQLAKELACVSTPRDTRAQNNASVTISVTSGATYWIEISALGATSPNADNVFMYVTPLVSTGVAVTPSSVDVSAGSGTQQFKAFVTGAANPAVRWTVTPPIGVISPAGVYTPPPSLDNPAVVTITATAFADTSQTASATVNLAPAGGSTPSISEVANATGEIPTVSQNTFIQIKGLNLAANTRIWQAADFVNNQMPTQLDGTGVTINGKNAYVYYISPKQVNILTPFDSSLGPLQVQLTYQGHTAQFSIPAQQLAPGFFSFDGIHPAAIHTDGSFIGPPSLYPGLTTPVKPGETIVLFGNGFGQTSPAIVPGSLAPSGTLPTRPVIRIGGIQAQVQFAGIVAPGEYQFNVVVPVNVSNGDNALIATYNGFVSQPGLMLTVQR
jgi:uncharacterized protein (TIGR03437 family)